MVKIGENGNEIANAHAWTPWKPNMVFLTVTYLTLYIRQGHKGGQKANRDAWVKKWTVIGGRKRHFLRCWQRRHSLWYDFQSLTKRRLQRRLATALAYQKRFIHKLPIRSDLRWSRTEGPYGREANAPTALHPHVAPRIRSFLHFLLQ